MTEVTFLSELTRKTVETVERAAIRHEQGVLTDKQFRIVMDAIWDCTSGLVDEIADLMNDANEMGLTPEKEQIVVSDGAKVFLIHRNNATVSMQNALTFEEFGLKSFFAEVDAVEHMARLRLAFKAKGFRVL